MSHAKLISLIKHVLLVFAGNTLYALAVTIFILPCGLVTGGSTGIALSVQHWFGVPVEDFVLIFNIITFILGYFALGKAFALSTALSTFFYPLILRVFQNIPFLQNLTTDVVLGTLLGGLMLGCSIGLVLSAGSSTGGLDFVPLWLNKHFRIPVSSVIYALDFFILLAQLFFSNGERVLYGILLVIIYSTILDKVLLAGHSRLQVKIVTTQEELVREKIIKNLDLGVTLLKAESGYARQEKNMLLTIVTNRQLAKLNQMVQEIDPAAFIIIHQVNEVHGRGFTIDRLYKSSTKKDTSAQ